MRTVVREKKKKKWHVYSIKCKPKWILLRYATHTVWVMLLLRPLYSKPSHLIQSLTMVLDLNFFSMVCYKCQKIRIDRNKTTIIQIEGSWIERNIFILFLFVFLLFVKKLTINAVKIYGISLLQHKIYTLLTFRERKINEGKKIGTCALKISVNKNMSRFNQGLFHIDYAHFLFYQFFKWVVSFCEP